MSEEVLASGSMERWSRGPKGVNGKWKPVYCVLYKNSTFTWFKTKGDKTPAGRVLMNEVESSLVIGSTDMNIPSKPKAPEYGNDECLISFPKDASDDTKFHFFMADSEEDFGFWMAAINKSLRIEKRSSHTEPNRLSGVGQQDPEWFTEWQCEMRKTSVKRHNKKRQFTDSEMPPVVFLDKDENNKWKVSDDAKKVLTKIDSCVATVAVVGSYRTGKSYVMNLLAGRKKGFALGATVQSMTKGIWLWAVKHPKNPDQCLLLLDTEGLNDVHKGDETDDMHLFTFAVLLSSVLVFNIKGNLGEDAFRQLELVAELSDKIQASDTKDSDDYLAAFFPGLIILLRDFFLELKDKDGKSITEQQYLDTSLELKTGSGKTTAIYNAPRECIAKYFPNRQLLTLPRPVASDNDLRHLDKDGVDTTPEFKRGSRHVLVKILDQANPMMLKSNTLSGEAYLCLAEEYAKAINSGTMPCLESSLECVADQEGQNAYNAAVDKYKKGLEPVEKQMPLLDEIVAKAHEAQRADAFECFEAAFKMRTKDKYKKHSSALQNTLTELHRLAITTNLAKSTEKCEAAMKKCFSELNTGIKDQKYAQEGGYKKYKKSKEKAIDHYKKEGGLGPKKMDTLNKFLESIFLTEQTIMESDKKLTEKEKQKAEKDEEIRKQKANADQLKAEKEQTEKQRTMENKEHQQIIGKMKEESQKEFHDYKQEQDKLIKNKEAYIEELKRKGHDVQRLKRELDDLKQDRKVEVSKRTEDMNEYEHAQEVLKVGGEALYQSARVAGGFIGGFMSAFT